MAKSKSVNKVARAAATTAPKAARPGDRPIFFPIAMAIVVVIGVVFVLLARDERREDIPDAAPGLSDHWHSAYSINVCGEEQAILPADSDVQFGLYTLGDGLIHIAPAIEEATGFGATVGAFFVESEGLISDEAIRIGDVDVAEGETLCDGEEGEVLVLKWLTADAEDPLVLSDGLGAVRFDQNDDEQGQLFTFAYMPIGEDLDVKALKPDTSLLDDYIDGDPPEEAPLEEAPDAGDSTSTTEG
ncbi:MAG: hypothetical protein GY708_17500 [Actinomycetia bacterium]|nr:hypothetical protein [Actinomycetes bacterium]MCP4957875.1 hypothetical protein [Actinomycetes bacterium]